MSFKDTVCSKLEWLSIRSLIVFVTALCACAFAQSPVYFEDIKLKAAVEDALWVYDPTSLDMQGLFELTCSNTINNGVNSLVGLETATNLCSHTTAGTFFGILLLEMAFYLIFYFIFIFNYINIIYIKYFIFIIL